MSTLLVVESPSKAKTVRNYLGSDYEVLATYGHLRDLASKNGMVEPEHGFRMHWTLSPRGAGYLKAIREALRRNQALLLATDPDREGEAIAWHLCQLLTKEDKNRLETPPRRVVFHEITKGAVTQAVQNPRDLNLALIEAYLARRALDYLVGFELSPVLWRKLSGARSAGRVQSVALRIVCDRELEINRFEPQEYWTVQGHLKTQQTEEAPTFEARLYRLEGRVLPKMGLQNEEAAAHALERAEKTPFRVAKSDSKQVLRRPFPPFITSTLQQEASRRLRFSVTKTMELAQRLYEGATLAGQGHVGLITYHRTDSVALAQQAIQQQRAYIAQELGKTYLPDKPTVYKSKVRNAQEAHEAIRPTDFSRTPQELKATAGRTLPEEALELYELVWRRALASGMRPAAFEQTTAVIQTGHEGTELRASGLVCTFEGFLKIYKPTPTTEETEKPTALLPPLEVGQELFKVRFSKTQHFTKPPPRFNEAGLVRELEEQGIGRPSTYASILRVLQQRNYVVQHKQRLVPSETGMLVSAYLKEWFAAYVKNEFTSNLEEELDSVANGTHLWREVLEAFWKDFASKIETAQEIDNRTVQHHLHEALGGYFLKCPPGGDLAALMKCRQCGEGSLQLKIFPRSLFFGCSNYPDCKYIHSIGTDETADSSAASAASTSATGIASKIESKLGEPQAGDTPKTPPEGPGQPRLLGTNDSGEPISFRKGPYGFYFQQGEDAKVARRTSLPKSYRPDQATLELALKCLSLPRQVALHPESGEPIFSKIGPYGPYLQYRGSNVRLKDHEEAFTIGENHAVALIHESEQRAVKRGRQIGTWRGQPVYLLVSRFGRTLFWQNYRAALPRTMQDEAFSDEELGRLLEKHISNGADPDSARKTARKKTTAKAGTKRKTAPRTRRAGA